MLADVEKHLTENMTGMLPGMERRVWNGPCVWLRGIDRKARELWLNHATPWIFDRDIAGELLLRISPARSSGW